MKNATRVLAALAVACLITAPAMGVGYKQLVSSSNVEAGGTGDRHWSNVLDGETAYFTLNGFSSDGKSANITKVENLGGMQVPSVVMTNAQWSAASGSTTMTNALGFGLSGNSLIFAEGGSDSIWKVDIATGAPTEYVPKATIQSVSGGTAVQLGNGNETTSTGEMVFFESSADNLMLTAGVNSTSILVSKTQLQSLHGLGTSAPSIVSGMTYDSGQNLYWGDATSDSMGMRAPDGTLSIALSTVDITAVTAGSSVTFGDVFYAPDGLIYFFESATDNIMRFDPASPAPSLEIFMTSAELLAGPMASTNVQSMGWYDGNLTLHTYQVPGVGSGNVASPLYVVPEPSVLALLGLGGLALIRRRR
ncbi:MAG: PEP-CTERM sorting domain-containing protein [Phycisphaerae bacterium]|nr:PEP-CTERM sorting domain-containing protein [Phycisphaerae bacterium]